MSISADVPGASAAAVLADAISAVRGLAETLWSARSDDELVEVVGLVQQATAALAAVEAGALVEVDARDLAKQELHYGSTGDWLTHLGGLRHGEGKKRLKQRPRFLRFTHAHPRRAPGRHHLADPGRRHRSLRRRPAVR